MGSQSTAHTDETPVETTGVDDAIWSPQQVCRHVSLSITTIWRLRQRGEFPDPVRLSPGRVGWRALDVKRWIAERKGQRVTDPVKPSPSSKRIA